MIGSWTNVLQHIFVKTKKDFEIQKYFCSSKGIVIAKPSKMIIENNKGDLQY